MQTLKYFHVKNNPLDSLITIQIILFQALRAQSDQHLWMSNNRLLENVGLGLGGVPQSSQQLNQPFPDLFNKPDLAPFNPNTLNVGKAIFNNCTRVEMLDNCDKCEKN